MCVLEKSKPFSDRGSRNSKVKILKWSIRRLTDTQRVKVEWTEKKEDRTTLHTHCRMETGQRWMSSQTYSSEDFGSSD